MAETWEQQEGEPDAAFARFLYYRNLGPLRSTDAAYEEYLKARGTEESETGLSVAPKSAKKRRAPGQWDTDSVKFNWSYRANQFDIHTLSVAGRSAIDSFYKALGAHAAQVLEAFLSGEFKPNSYEQMLEGLSLLGSFISPEAVEAWQSFASRNRPSTARPGPDQDE